MVAVLLLATLLAPLAGCSQQRYDPALASPAYPADLHRAQSVDIQVFREGSDIELVNATADSYFDFELWVNQRYTRHVDALPAGETIRLSLWDFFDELGENFSAGGFWRTEEPTAVRLVEIQLGSDQPMIGLITIQPTQAR